MNRITEAERKRFHKIVDDSINKMNSPKNVDKAHWKYIDIKILQKHISIENAELDLAVSDIPIYPDLIESEIYDILNYGLFMADNVRNNQ